MLRRFLIPLAMAIAALTAVAGCAATYDRPQPGGFEQPRGEVDVSYFYGALSPYGDWIQTDEYGLVWCPINEPVDWRPYTDGEWVWTNYGWTWVADEDWGWAPYHYGRWYDDAYNGWCWVPGRDWSPAWVAWREGGGYIGWAPLPPAMGWQVNVGFSSNDWDHMPGVEHYWWSFALARDLPGPGISRRLAPRHRGGVLVAETHNITNYTYVDAHVANRSLDIEPIRRAHGKNIPTRVITDISAPPASHSRQVAGNTFNAYRPEMREAPAQAAPAAVRPARRVPVNAEQANRAPQVTPQTQARIDREAVALRTREAADKKRLQQDQLQETKKPPVGVDADKLRAQHQQEQKALDNQTARDERVLKSRQEQRQQNPATKADSPRKQAQPVKDAKGDAGNNGKNDGKNNDKPDRNNK